MAMLLLIDTLVAVFFALGIVFFAKTLPWPWAVALAMPVMAAYLVYKKLGRVEASMNETIREYETFFSDRKKTIYAGWAGLTVIGGLIIFGLAGDVTLLPIDETNSTIKRVNTMAGELESIRKTMEKQDANEETRFRNSLELQRGISDRVASLDGKVEILRTMAADSGRQAESAEKSRQTLDKIEKILSDIKEILARVEEVKNESKK